MLQTPSARFLFETVPAEANRLGECPIWCERTKRLWWVDVLTPALWCYDPATDKSHRHHFRGRRLGSIALRSAGGLILACDDGIYNYDPHTGDQRFLVNPEPQVEGHRKNDGRADPLGNFWVGTLEEETFSPVGVLYRIDPLLGVTLQANGLKVPNSLAFDTDRRRMYLGDSRAHTIWVFDYDPASGEISNQRIFATTTAPAKPDGSCIDSEGFLWNAEYAGGRVVRYSPDGQVNLSIDLPVTYPTCCCFGGPELDRLFVTSAKQPLNPETQGRGGMAGRLISLEPGVRGHPEFRVGF